MRKGKEVLETKTEDLLVDLEPKEVDAKARKLAEKLTELERWNEESRKLAADRGQRKATLEGEVKKLREAVTEKAELRPVVVEVWADWKKTVVVEVRQDTGATVSERAMRSDERQPSIATVVDLPKNESPKAVARKLFSDGVRVEDVGIEKKVQEASAAAGVEVAAVLDELVELGEAAAAKKGTDAPKTKH